jgi:predicted nucleotidyltransferase
VRVARIALTRGVRNPNDSPRISVYIWAMKLTEAREKLRSFAAAIQAMGATSLYLFGSTARDESRSDSDLDLFVDYDPGGHFNAFDPIGIKHFLEDELHAAVDITTRDGLHPMLRDDIEKTAIRVF